MLCGGGGLYIYIYVSWRPTSLEPTLRDTRWCCLTTQFGCCRRLVVGDVVVVVVLAIPQMLFGLRRQRAKAGDSRNTLVSRLEVASTVKRLKWQTPHKRSERERVFSVVLPAMADRVHYSSNAALCFFVNDERMFLPQRDDGVATSESFSKHHQPDSLFKTSTNDVAGNHMAARRCWRCSSAAKPGVVLSILCLATLQTHNFRPQRQSSLFAMMV